MANPLDEVNGPIAEQGRDVNVIQKQIPVKVGVGSTIFEVLLWIFGIFPGVIFLVMKQKARNHLRSLEQRVQHDASTIDNFLEQRVQILKNAAKLLDKAIDLDKDTYTKIAAYRSGNGKAHNELEECLRQNSYLQKEITAAREQYNDTIYKWNHDIMQWPTKMIVAAKDGYTTRIPFTASKEVKEEARGTFF